MSLKNICNICGSNYEYKKSRWVCPGCGAYKEEELSPEEATLLYGAAQKLRLSNFSEAEEAYTDIIEKYPQNANAYWGRLLSKYGIKYEEDFDGRKIPTCYAASIESVTEDDDYKKAIEFADTENQTHFTNQASYIERVRKEWIEKASKEEPYDVFLCYKESDREAGIERTADSVAVQDLYIHLTSQGYRVFYSRESLREKVGEKYEPYIFNALSTAKVMLVYGSSAEYIKSTWLKNEWHRFYKKIASGEKHQEAWKFIKWWLSTETQTRFSNGIVGTYGETFMWNTANVEAFKTLPIKKQHIETIIASWEDLYNIPQTPATYIVERGISDAWNAAVFDGVSVRAAISDAVIDINKEIDRKMSEFGFVDNKGNLIERYFVPTPEEIRKWMED